jgi:hypothetical protein
MSRAIVSLPRWARPAPARSRPVLGRRAFLGGCSGVALGLPFLESLLPRSEARAATSTPPRRFLCYYVPNGVWMGGWAIPARATTSTFNLSPTLTSIASIREDTLIINGLHNRPGIPRPVGGAHGTGVPGLLCCAEWKSTGGKVGTSMDQIAANAIGSATALPSMQLGVEKHGPYDEIGVPSLAHGTLSWRNSQPLAKVTDPKLAFDRLFMGVDPKQSAADAQRRRMLKQSILDQVLDQQKSLLPRLGSEDAKKLGDYFQSVRDLEARVAATVPIACGATTSPTTGDYRTNLTAMHDIMALAFQCDATRVITFQAADALATYGMPWVGVDSPHGITHTGDTGGIQRVDKWRLEQFATFIKKLGSLQDVDGKSVLANSAVYYTSEVSDGGRHSNENRPTLLCGQLGGAIKTGRLLVAGTPNGSGADGSWTPCDEGNGSCANQTPAANLYVALLNGLGAPTTSFPSSTGMLALT